MNSALLKTAVTASLARDQVVQESVALRKTREKLEQRIMEQRRNQAKALRSSSTSKLGRSQPLKKNTKSVSKLPVNTAAAQPRAKGNQSARSQLSTMRIFTGRSNISEVSRDTGEDNIWGRIAKLEAEEYEKRERAEKEKRLKQQEEMQKFLDQQLRAKEEQRLKELEAEKQFAKQQDQQLEEWKAKLKEDRERELAKGRKYQQESAEQAEMVRERVNRERRKQFREDMKMVNRAKKEIEEEKAKRQRQKELEKKRLDETVEFNKKELLRKKEQLQKQWEEDRKIAALAVKMADEREEARKAGLRKIYARQERLVDVGRFAIESTDSKVKRDEEQAEYYRRLKEAEDDREARRREEKRRKMIEECKLSLQQQMERDRQLRLKEIEEDREILKRNKQVAAEANAEADRKARERRLANIKHKQELEKHMVAYARQKRRDDLVARGGMSEMELSLNRNLIEKAKKYSAPQLPRVKDPVLKKSGERMMKSRAQR